MNESALNKIKVLVEARRVFVFSSAFPKAESIAHLKESGYLTSVGKVVEDYKSGLPVSRGKTPTKTAK